MLTEVKNYRGFVLSKFIFFSASGGLCPSDTLTRGSAAGPRWGLRPRPLHHSEEIAATGISEVVMLAMMGHIVVSDTALGTLMVPGY